MNERILTDKELGTLLVRPHSRARRFTFRPHNDGFLVITPPGVPLPEVMQAVETLRPRLLQMKPNKQQPLIDYRFSIEAPLFGFSLSEGTGTRFLSRTDAGRVHITCPPHTDFSSPELQKWLHRVLTESLRRMAKELLPPRLSRLAQHHGLTYKEVKINGSRGRWGSCSTRGSINLSYYLLLLPEQLIDYVLLHELAHTREMNHSPRFWALLDQFTSGRSSALRAELKQVHLLF